ncbi:uncharacterized protein involved in exopolysaccharide biosynthesis [Bradyrhizobium diazoefficiens]
MLHRPVNSTHQDTLPPEFRSPAEFVADSLAFLRRHFSIVVLTCSSALGVALLYLIMATPTFTARAQLIVDSKAVAADPASVSTVVESQIAVLKSEGIARTVVAKLGLAEDPEFSGGMVRRLRGSASRLLGWSKQETNSDVTPYSLYTFERRLSAKRAGLTYIVDLAFDSSDPERAAQILNTIVDTYIATQMDAKYKWGLQNEKWVKDRVNELSSQALAAKKAVADFNKNRNDIANSAAAKADTASSQLNARTQGELEASADAAARAYDNFLRMLRHMDAMQQQSALVFEARLLTEVSSPFTASWPKPTVVLGMAIIGGMLLGIAIGMLRDLLDRGRAPARWPGATASGGAAVVPGLKANSSKPYFDGAFKVDKQHPYKEANPD